MTKLPRSHDMSAPRWWLMAAAGMAGTMGAVAGTSLQIRVKTADDGCVAAAGGGYLGNPVGWLRVGVIGDQSGILFC
jgi:hypothetical protein